MPSPRVVCLSWKGGSGVTSPGLPGFEVGGIMNLLHYMSRTCKCAVSGKTSCMNLNFFWITKSQTLFIYSHHQEGQNDYITPYCACMHGIINLTATWLCYVIVGVKACALSPLPS